MRWGVCPAPAINDSIALVYLVCFAGVKAGTVLYETTCVLPIDSKSDGTLQSDACSLSYSLSCSCQVVVPPTHVQYSSVFILHSLFCVVSCRGAACPTFSTACLHARLGSDCEFVDVICKHNRPFGYTLFRATTLASAQAHPIYLTA